MSRGQKIILIVLSLMILGVLMLIYSSPAPVDWSPSFEQNDTRPLGSKVFYDLVKKQEGNWQEVNSPPFELIEELPDTATYVFINDYFNSDPNEIELLLNWVDRGGHLFISASGIPNILLDSLGLSYQFYEEEFESERTFILSLESPMTLSQPATYNQFHSGEYFQWEDSLHVNTLGKIRGGDEMDSLASKPNFIQLRKGNGLVTLHAFPEAFSNYFLLNSINKAYTEQVLGTWDLDSPVLLDHYIKSGKGTGSSPLYLVLSNPYLKAAYLTCWLFLVLWVVFEGKRKQKAIKFIPPVQNKSLEFAKTISSIYLKQEDMTQLGQLQLSLFWYNCRTQFHLHGDNKEELTESLSVKSGVSLEEIQKLVQRLSVIEAKTQLNSKDILLINQLIEEFKSKQTHGRNLQPAG